jgi:hypothetical protein
VKNTLVSSWAKTTPTTTWSCCQATARTSAGPRPPTGPRELALLFANLRESFQRDWYWSSEPHATRGQLVWGQNFASGIQTIYGRPYRGHARAIRRISTAA